MLLEDYISLLESPDSVSADDIADLQALISYAPYCQSANLLLLKALYKAHDTSYEAFLPKAVCYATSPREAWRLLHPKEITRKATMAQGDYFAFVNQLETIAEQTGQTFLELAKRFQESRRLMTQTTSRDAIHRVSPNNEAETPSINHPLSTNNPPKDEILQKLQAQYDENLRNPKKSIYFADQMRFLEKAMALREAQKKQKQD